LWRKVEEKPETREVGEGHGGIEVEQAGLIEVMEHDGSGVEVDNSGTELLDPIQDNLPPEPARAS
jgi:hypothetical protein